jgi:hypothetical protein
MAFGPIIVSWVNLKFLSSEINPLVNVFIILIIFLSDFRLTERKQKAQYYATALQIAPLSLLIMEWMLVQSVRQFLATQTKAEQLLVFLLQN